VSRRSWNDGPMAGVPRVRSLTLLTPVPLYDAR
jgi:hypothetical protein